MADFPEFGIGGGPAFPLVFEYMDEHGTMRHIQSGMSIRDYFAAKAMAAIRSNEAEMKDMRAIATEHRVDVTAVVAQYANAQANAMLKERDR